MIWDVFVVQFCLGVILFFLINWVGRHSYSIGYMSISVFAKVEEAPAFNFLIRVLAPTVYIIICATILYYLKLDRFVQSFFLVNLYYIIFRLAFNLITGRGSLLNWYRQVLYWVSIMVISYFTYSNLIISKKNLLPDFETIANELWIIILIFLFQVANNIRLSNDKSIQRKDQYARKMVAKFGRKYGHLIDQIKNERIRALVLAILIIENFNRPKVARWIEYAKFYLTKKPHTLGVMQFHTDKYISDHESVELGIKKIVDKYETEIQEFKDGLKDQYYSKWTLEYNLAGSYNTGAKYNEDVTEMWKKVVEIKYPNTKDVLM